VAAVGKHKRASKSGTSSGIRVSPATSVMLVGFMGAGKSTVGSALAARLGCAFEDLDDRIERQAGRSVPEIFRDAGELEFRRMERAALGELLDELGRGSKKVVALGGGAFAQAANTRLIRAAGIPTIFLDAPVEELWRRCNEQTRNRGDQRPLSKDWDDFCRLYRIRRPRYLKARLRQKTSGKDIAAIVAEIIAALGFGEPAEELQ